MSSSAERALLAAVLLGAGVARADIFSPGPLSKAHAQLEGLKNCTKCHVAGSQLSNDTCNACHAEIQTRVAKHEGFHGRLAPAELACNRCHKEHQGRDFKLIDWGAAGEKGFDHARTGFALKGKHASASCAQCHNDRFIADAAVRELRAKQPGRATFLGAATQCAQCHFDEHRGQLSTACRECHDERGWKPAPGFDHAAASFALEGAHARVECLKCHARALDAESHANAPLKPVAESFSRFKPVAHASCTDCHKDPHEGRLGESCTSCHNVSSWKQISSEATPARAFHDKTRYPLRGAHVEVACASCHGPAPGVPARFKGLAFERCTDCHVDAHLGQLGQPPQACDACHTLQAFTPAVYEPARHRGFPLEGAHAAVACSSCHRAAPALAAREKPLLTFLQQRRRHDALSLIDLHPKGTPQRCDTCHADAHAGQFAARVKQSGCADCHTVASFTAVRFDHARESRFPLTGAHAQAQCASCHAADAAGVVRYKPLATACAACHADVHAGQFASAPGDTDCARCHDTARFERTTFEHHPPWTSFELQGKHAQVACASCHAEVALTAGAKARRYRGVPVTCAGCHVDVHKGAFRELAR